MPNYTAKYLHPLPEGGDRVGECTVMWPTVIADTSDWRQQIPVAEQIAKHIGVPQVAVFELTEA